MRNSLYLQAAPGHLYSPPRREGNLPHLYSYEGAMLKADVASALPCARPMWLGAVVPICYWRANLADCGLPAKPQERHMM